MTMFPTSDWVYIIPPYLLHTSLGAKLHRQLALISSELANSNAMPTCSPHYEAVPESKPIPQYHFSADPTIHNIIRDKLIYKFQIIGILGTSPKPPSELSDEEVYELFETFEHKLLADETMAKTASDTASDGSHPGSNTRHKKLSIESDTFGEVSLSTGVPLKYQKYLSYSLRDLLLHTKLEQNGKLPSQTRFLKVDDTYFDYSLPSSWVSLIPSSSLNSINRRVSIDCTHGDGYAQVEVATLKDPQANLEAIPSTYFNFITNNPVTPSSGIFYYEVEIVQECTQATDMAPLLANSDTSLASKNASQFCVGFVKRFLHHGPRNPSSPPPATLGYDANLVDLETIKDELVFSQDKMIQKPLDLSIEALIDDKPGEMKASFALDLGDSNFYNSIKGSESAQRTTILSMNRRLSSLSRQSIAELDSGRIDTEVTFSTNKVRESKSEKILKSDVVGFGINYIDNSLFITLNGVLLRTISKQELMSSNPLNDNLFSSSNPKGDSVYPMIGFKLNDVSINDKTDIAPTKLTVRGNFGFKDFKFNINHWVNLYKRDNEKDLNLRLLQQSQTAASSSDPNDVFEGQLLNVHDNSALLNRLIKGYLYTEGYTETFNALASDLKELSDITATKNEPNNDSKVIERSHAQERHALKMCFLQNRFDSILEILNSKYERFFSDKAGQILIFDIKLYKLIHCLKIYVEKLLNLGSREFEFEYDTNLSSSELYTQALNLATSIQKEYANNEEQTDKIRSAVVLLLVKDIKGYNNLPHIHVVLEKYQDKTAELFELVNKRILKGLSFNQTSNLESIVTRVDRNVEELTLTHCDNKFSLINFERDQLEL
ncbi:hypothetical protein PSN45_002896 [Yamadazyma tenuis]|uniref:Uncharacterized protein n=1 Tax=Candida tenuis (strain ATCC 10573 / BCRC 21748 / CBS 615 / JCM 9827 / NBRC 10315 / NRRL Y-1498 / VKM Y-70) TaxID=590646 RepID=G3AWC2_CANTC|nr:uncharacterized protein CANTEDRAFT_91670 [Yamadazyma tenuis ATCC 10573]EGV66509.1 hypothetical protein CANTEDRAFT_91670 [Yamadazyma tenuis ATCC 10573]WEJ95379.1 hypothetical protein PSN45_002896 [Yamadazyma tenuis]